MTRQTPRRLTTDEIGILVGFGSILLGAGLYFYPPALAGFPVNDGGLFYNMIRAIQQNSFRLPDHVQYNGLNIPFAYPPLGFYLAGLISSMPGIGLLQVVQWLPSFTLVGVSIAFFFLARRVLDSRIEAGIATFLYVCTPRSMTWLVMGGGITRGLGQLFLILTITNVYALFSDHRRKHLVLSILLGALVILTHPEASLHTVAACILLWIFRGRNWQSTLDAVLVGVGVTIVSAIWWLPKLLQFGIGPFTSAAQTGLHTSILFIYPFLLTLSEEPAITLIAALGLIGLAACVAGRDYLLPIWMLLPFAVEPRGAATVAIVPLALMGAISIRRVLYPGLVAIEGSAIRAQSGKGVGHGPLLAIAAYIALFLLVMGTYAAMQLSQVKVSTANQAAFAWVAENTPPQSRFLIMTGDTELFCDPVQEWFPVLTHGISDTTIQGDEWASNGTFFVRVAQLQDMQRCLSSDSPLACVQNAAQTMGVDFDYIYLSKHVVTKQLCRATGEAIRGTALSTQLSQSGGYSRVYGTDEVEIFARSAGSAFTTAKRTEASR